MLTTLLLLVEQYSVLIVVGSFIVGLVITWLLFRQCNGVVGFLGKSGAMAIWKIVSLLPAVIAIKMICQGSSSSWDSFLVIN